MLKLQMEKVETASKTSTASSKGYTLSQNAPNPFNGTSVINYTLPGATEKAVLWITDLSGKMMQQYNLAKGTTRQLIDANSLVSGIYIYSLVADGTEILSRRMVVAK